MQGRVHTNLALSPGALIAGAWAVMQHMGEECVPSIASLFVFLPRELNNLDAPLSICRGYVASCRDIVGAAKSIESRIKSEIPELYILGKPPASVVAFGSRRPNVSVLEVGDRMSKKGWHLNAIQGPSAVHIACTVSVKSIASSKLEFQYS